MKRKTKLMICLPVLAVIIVLMIAANIVAGIFSTSLTALLCPPIPNKAELNASREQGQALSRDIVAEGTTLVKNNGALPLSSETKKVNLFGYVAYNMIYSGWGAGSVASETNDPTSLGDIPKALAAYGIDYNPSLARVIQTMSEEADIANKAYYTEDVLANAKAYSDTAFVVLGRSNGEGSAFAHNGTSAAHGLAINAAERSILTYVGANYENTVVLINGTNHMQLDFMDTIPGLDACLVLGTTGTQGVSALPLLLWGEVSPSGHLTDTLAYDFLSAVSIHNSDYETKTYFDNPLLADIAINNAKSTDGPAFVDYVEGIYVGYKFYETADAEGVWTDEERTCLDGEDRETVKRGYDAVVQYPFGFGMSYTTFDWNVESVTVTPRQGEKNDDIAVTVRVTNTGNYPGRDAVSLYVNAPYNPDGRESAIEKSHVSLVDFEKTMLLYPSDKANGTEKFDSCLVTLHTTSYDLASYDCYDANGNGHTGYELEHGTYGLWLMTDSHRLKQDASGSDEAYRLEYSVTETVNYTVDPVTQAPVDNLFTGENAVDGISVDGLGEAGGNQAIAYISRADMPKTVAAAERRAMDDAIAERNLYAYDADSRAWDDADKTAFGEDVDRTPVVWGSGAGDLKVYDGNGVTELGLRLGNPANWGDPDWDRLLAQVTREEALALTDVTQAGNKEINSIGKPKLNDIDGPLQAGGYSGVALSERGTGYPSATTLGQTWSKTVAESFGFSMAADMNAIGYDGLYGLGVNLHRSLFNGRNFEYYAEDAYLSGIMAGKAMKSMLKGGKYGYLKHFALNETDPERYALYTWLSEQALREIYLKPFRMVVVDQAMSAIMTAYNRIGGVWAGGSDALVGGVLLKEWKFKGGIITDYANENDRFNRWGYMSMDRAIRTGGNLGMFVGHTGATKSSSSERLDHALRDAVKNVTYMWLHAMWANDEYNKNPTDGKTIVVLPSTPSFVWWIPLLADVDIVVFGGCLLALFLLFAPKSKNDGRKTEDAETPSES